MNKTDASEAGRKRWETEERFVNNRLTWLGWYWFSLVSL